jgi:starch-binding outer membrane protein, SusD/RagB family
MRTPLNAIRSIGLALATVAIAACSSDKLDITNPNTPTVESASADAQALQLQATGLLRQLRNGRGGTIFDFGRFGRELYIYSPQEGRNTSAYLQGITGANKLDPAGFAVGEWGTQYGNLRDIFNLKNSAGASASLTAAQKSAALGFAKTLEGLELLYVISSRDTLGAIVEIKQNASDLAGFVSRDSVYKYILATLDEGNTALTAGGTAFPFTLHSGFTGFNTPATFAKFNRALAGKAAAYYATSGGGAAAWQRSLTALTASYLNTAATSRADLDVGPVHPYSGSTGDAGNPFFGNSADLFLHPSTETDAPLKADGTKDNRYLAKVKTKTPRGPPSGVTGIASSLGYVGDASISASVPILRNEELMLLRAEGLLATGDKAGALAIVNSIRVNSGGLAPSALTAASADAAVLDEILLQKRYSLMLEGTRWIDMRRYGRLNTLPLDASNHFVAKVMPIPQGECLVRVGKTGALAGPGC